MRPGHEAPAIGGPLDGTPVGEVVEQFGREERVPPAVLEDQIEEVVACSLAEDRPRQLTERRRGERLELRRPAATAGRLEHASDALLPPQDGR